ncbi:MAG: XdhC family protein [bacterium]|nr:XdhC family protein [bacterium]
MNDIALFGELADAMRGGTRVCLATVVETSGSTPRKAGAHMLVYADGRSSGTVGGGLIESDMINAARQVLADGTPHLELFNLNAATPAEHGMICGGQMRVFLTPLGHRRNLYIFGAGHCGVALTQAAAAAGFCVHVFDDRPELVTRERLPLAQTLCAAPYAQSTRELQPQPDAYVAIMTHAHKADALVLRNILATTNVYLGMMSSVRKREQIFAQLAAEGVAPDALARVQAPIGLAINAETPEEIAVSIVAQIIQVARARESQSGRET